MANFVRMYIRLTDMKFQVESEYQAPVSELMFLMPDSLLAASFGEDGAAGTTITEDDDYVYIF